MDSINNIDMIQERELPAILEHDFVITDESVNRYGWRLLVAGIDLTGFLKNPVCCVQHVTSLIPVGKWKNIRVEGQELKGTLEFDRNDSDAVKLYWKYKDGYMNAVSLNVVPWEESDVKELLQPGQTKPTVTKCELLEISIVTLPGQKNAVKLSTPEGNEYKLNLLSTSNNPSGQTKVQKAQELILVYKNKGVLLSSKESIHLLSIAENNLGLVKQILESKTTIEDF